jgi:hypothetical protein
MPIGPSSVIRIIGIYNARGTLRGEITYLLRRTFAKEHCALCDITHGSVRRRPGWDRCSQVFTGECGIPVDLLHLNQAPSDVLDRADFHPPAIYFQKSDGSFILALSQVELEACNHSPEALFSLLNQKLGEFS